MKKKLLEAIHNYNKPFTLKRFVKLSDEMKKEKRKENERLNTAFMHWKVGEKKLKEKHSNLKGRICSRKKIHRCT